MKSILFPWRPFSYAPGGPIYGTARKLTLHTMECGGVNQPCWPTYRGGGVPHISTTPGIETRQHISFARSAYALASPGHPRSPNMNAGLHVQVEVAGRSADVPNYPQWWYEALADTIWKIAVNCRIPVRFPFGYGGGPEGYGTNGAYRQAWSRYQPASGIIQHSNAPNPNTHWDADGMLKRLAPLLLERARGEEDDMKEEDFDRIERIVEAKVAGLFDHGLTVGRPDGTDQRVSFHRVVREIHRAIAEPIPVQYGEEGSTRTASFLLAWTQHRAREVARVLFGTPDPEEGAEPLGLKALIAEAVKGEEPPAPKE